MYSKLRNNRTLNLLIIGIRFLVGFAFIPSGLKKVLGERFTSIGTDHPIGYFFEAMYRTGFYYEFLGFCQLLAAFLLFTQKFATLGALMFFGIILNICVLTISMHFTGTWIITSLMLFAGTVLLVWDWNKLKPILGLKISETHDYKEPNYKWQIAGFILFIILLSSSILLKSN
ncbi:DoxX family protein [Epilithonimonas sp. JDS]|uniref:DoxX family protein n=1 Tax=Epilithonimonas sp. JDS TaxID=2902797 RepID=UPI001E372151|nr:DoxX family protein [Epilithonimonas sp. JDS]MCD9853108.1 DoxX family protein [Epilithonimonas sp. JDS]